MGFLGSPPCPGSPRARRRLESLARQIRKPAGAPAHPVRTMNFLSNILAFLVVIGVIIFIHELGHFLAARLFRIRVRVFSVGIGTRLWGFERNGTEYRLAMIPLGGYVAFSGIDAANPTGDAGDFTAKPRWQRMVVLLAGPAANVVLSIGPDRGGADGRDRVGGTAGPEHRDRRRGARLGRGRSRAAGGRLHPAPGRRGSVRLEGGFEHRPDVAGTPGSRSTSSATAKR